MGKLFGFESTNTSDDSNDLLIDKIISKSKEPKSPMNLTADILQKREALRVEIEDKISDTSDTKPTESEEEPEDTTTESEEDTAETTEPKEESATPTDNKEEVPEDKEAIKGLIGADLKKSEPTEKPATESIVTPTLRNVFDPIRIKHLEYTSSLARYALEGQATPIDKQPIVYVKEAVLESLKRLIALANLYTTNNEKFQAKTAKALTILNERIAVFKSLTENGKHHFTQKLVNDRDILVNLSYKEVSDPRDTIRTLVNYVTASNRATVQMVTNTFDKLSDSYITSGFEQGTDSLTYKAQIPGFNLVNVAIIPYTNYLTTKLEDYHYYRLKSLKTEDAYELSAISINEDKELMYVIEFLDKLLIAATISVDNLNDTTGHFNTYVEALKVLVYDIENNKFKNLAESGIDEKVQDFVKFKLAVECYILNINIVIEYMTSMMSVLNVTVTLKE